MTSPAPLSPKYKLEVTYRVEPGCLGPEGQEHIERFCQFAERGVAKLDAEYVRWHITPRHDKNLPEMHYSVDGKSLSHDKADQYLQFFQKSLDEFEEHLQDSLAKLIDYYWRR